jgi:triacylglycerol lipase
MLRQNHAPRLHLVFVPGFGGFDALGQVEYYAGTTQAFQSWASVHTPSRPVALHYFSGIPTAGVRTRAALLERYLVKLLLRGQVLRGDRIALIGHSTGGLDIRQLLLQLERKRDRPLLVDGVEDTLKGSTARGPEGLAELSPEASNAARPFDVKGRDLLEAISSVVFLSVPQRGTNIANWVLAHSHTWRALIGSVRLFVDGLDLPGLTYSHRIAQRTRKLAGWPKHLRLPPPAAPSDVPQVQPPCAQQALPRRDALVPGALLAIEDALAEVLQKGWDDPLLAADGRSALADLNQWLSHTHGDYLALHDLACPERKSLVRRVNDVLDAVALTRAPRGEDVTDIAHRTDAQRQEELELWRSYDIATRSYATLGRPPFEVRTERSAELSPWSDVLGHALRPDARSDAVYRFTYAMCCSGPFSEVMREDRATLWGSTQVRKLEAWENDGIVNTASMLWPHGEETRLIEADHLDIVGHYALTPKRGSAGARRYHAYDMLRSDSRFCGPQFAQVWHDIFSFCTAQA